MDKNFSIACSLIGVRLCLFFLMASNARIYYIYADPSQKGHKEKFEAVSSSVFAVN